MSLMIGNYHRAIITSNMSEIQAKTYPWQPAKASLEAAIIYMKGRQTGSITSLKTPWSKFNDATTDGIEWHSTTIIAARPATGKTLIKDQIVREAFTLNPKEKMRVLEFQFEMVGRVSGIRMFSAFMKRSYKYLCSADGKVTDDDIQKCIEYAKSMKDLPIDVVEEPCTVNEFANIITQYMELHATTKVVKDKNGNDKVIKVYTNTIVTLDHSLLLKKASFEKNKQETLFNLGEALTRLKRKYPIAFIVLSQLNRDIDKPERNENGKYGNYVLESDIYGADALLQHADVLVGVNRPGKQRIAYYGIERYCIEDEDVLVFHFIKTRNGDTRLSFMKAEFKHMRVSEMNTPRKQELHKTGDL